MRMSESDSYVFMTLLPWTSPPEFTCGLLCQQRCHEVWCIGVMRGHGKQHPSRFLFLCSMAPHTPVCTQSRDSQGCSWNAVYMQHRLPEPRETLVKVCVCLSEKWERAVILWILTVSYRRGIRELMRCMWVTSGVEGGRRGWGWGWD